MKFLGLLPLLMECSHCQFKELSWAPRAKCKALERAQSLFKAALQSQCYKDKNYRNSGKKGGNEIKG